MQTDRPERRSGARGAGFVRLFTEYRPRVIRTLRRYGVEGPDVEDLAQVAFFAYARQREPRPDPGPWLCEAARKLAANWRRLYRHEFEIPTPGDVLQDMGLDRAPSPDDLAELAEWCEAAERLPHGECAALRLHLQGYSTKGAGALLGCRPNTTHARIRRAQKRLDLEETEHATR